MTSKHDKKVKQIRNRQTQFNDQQFQLYLAYNKCILTALSPQPTS